jgi:LmeA-like phospholipid-binding
VRKWIFIVLPTVLLLALLVGDQAAKGWAETKLAERAAAYYPPGSGSSATIHAFPFIPRLLLTATVPQVDVNLDNLRIQEVLVRRLSIHVADVKLDRDELFRGTVHVRDAGQGTIVATLDGPALARAIGSDVRFTPGEVEVHQRIQGVDVKAKGKLAVKGSVVTVTPTSVEGLSVPAGRFAISYRIPGIELLPCQADVKVIQNGVVLSCDTVDIPAALIQAAQSGR